MENSMTMHEPVEDDVSEPVGQMEVVLKRNPPQYVREVRHLEDNRGNKIECYSIVCGDKPEHFNRYETTVVMPYDQETTISKTVSVPALTDYDAFDFVEDVRRQTVDKMLIELQQDVQNGRIPQKKSIDRAEIRRKIKNARKK